MPLIWKTIPNSDGLQPISDGLQLAGRSLVSLVGQTWGGRLFSAPSASCPKNPCVPDLQNAETQGARTFSTHRNGETPGGVRENGPASELLPNTSCLELLYICLHVDPPWHHPKPCRQSYGSPKQVGSGSWLDNGCRIRPEWLARPHEGRCSLLCR